MNHLLVGLILIATTSSILANPDVDTTDSTTPRMLILGDSLSAGYGMKAEESWVALLGQRLKQKGFIFQIINASISGNTTGNGLRQLPPLLSQYQPDITLIELGGNDGLRGLSLQAMKSNLQSMVDMAKSNNSRVILAGVKLPPNYGKQYTENFYNIYQQIARQNKIDLIPFILEGVGDKSEYMQADGIHPTALAQAKILNVVWPHVISIIRTTNTRSVTQPSALTSTE